MKETPQASELAYQRIRDLILRQGLRPGEQTSVVKLSTLTRLGRSPVKQAITRLQAEGLLNVSDRQGTFVRELDAKDVRELFAFRRLLEGYAAGLAAKRISERQLGRLAALLEILHNESIAKPPKDRSVVRFIDADVEFHRLLIAAADNDYLQRAYATLNLHFYIGRYLHTVHTHGSKDRHDEHIQMVEALKAGNASELEEVLMKHSNSVESSILSAMQQYEDSLVWR